MTYILNKKLIGLIFITGFIWSCKSLQQNNANHKALPNLSNITATVLQEKGVELFQYWEFNDEEFWWSHNLGNIQSITQYQDSVKDLLDLNYLKIINREKNQSAQPENFSRTEDRDKTNLDLVQKGLLGNIRKMNYLEAQVLNYQLNKYPLLSHPTEFHAFIALHEIQGKIRIYFAASDQGFPPQPRIIISELEREAFNGWKLIYHLHNHYGDEESDYLGKMAPSLADAQYFKMLKERFAIEKALITNGFTTVEIPASNFEKFESH